MIATRDQLGIGIYTPEDAALYARVSTRLMKRWIFGDGTGQAAVHAQIPGQDDDKVVTFLDFVQAMAIRVLRNTYKIPLQKIRQAVDAARDEYSVPYPFAVRHKTFLFSDQRKTGHGDLVINLSDETTEKFVQISGRFKGNLVMKEIVELYLDDLAFGADGFASEYCAWRSNDHKITMNPKVRFGEPMVSRCGYSAFALWEASIIEGGLEQAAKAYDVDVKDVSTACMYFDHLQSPATA